MSSSKDGFPIPPDLPPLLNISTHDQLNTTDSVSSYQTEHHISQPFSSSDSVSSHRVLNQTVTAESTTFIPSTAPPGRLYKTPKRRLARTSTFPERYSPEPFAKGITGKLRVNAVESVTVSEPDVELSKSSDEPKPKPSKKKNKFPPSLEAAKGQKMTLQELADVLNATSKLISDANGSSSQPSEEPLTKLRNPFSFSSISNVDELPSPKTMLSSADIPSQPRLTPDPDEMSLQQITTPLLPADTGKELFVSTPPSSKTLPLPVQIQPSSRNSKGLETSFTFDSIPSSPQSVGSSVYSPSDLPPRQPDFNYTSFQEGDVILVDRSDVGDGLRKAKIIFVNKEYSSSSQYFEGELVVLKPAAQKRCQDGTHTVYYVHYTRLDRRMDEWIDVHEIHSAVDKPNPQSPSQPRSGLVMSDLSGSPTKKTRRQRKKAEEFQHNEKTAADLGATLARCEEAHEKATMLKNIDSIQVGDNVVRCWYFSPYPTDAIAGRHVYICDFCLMYFSMGEHFQLHTLHCKPKPPPGEVVYADEKNSFVVYEVIGAQNRFYCQSLCLLSKLFLDHKTLYYQVDTFYFYILCEIDSNGWPRLAGHFSKENFSMNNLACIMVLPPYQRKGYGKFLIQLSYVFSCREGYMGTPEKPLSDLGKVSYRGFWWWLLVNYIEHNTGCKGDIPINELQQVSGILAADIISTFGPLDLTKKYKGEMMVSMSPHILRFCKSLPLFNGPKLLLDVDLVQWTDRYLPVKMNKKKKAKVVSTEKATVQNAQKENKDKTIEVEREEEAVKEQRPEIKQLEAPEFFLEAEVDDAEQMEEEEDLFLDTEVDDTENDTLDYFYEDNSDGDEEFDEYGDGPSDEEEEEEEEMSVDENIEGE